MYGRRKKLSKPKAQNQSEENKVSSIRNPFILKKGIKQKQIIEDRIIKDIRTLFEEGEEGYYKPKRVRNFWSNNYIEYEINRNKNLSLKEHLNKVKPYLRNIIIDFHEFDNGKFS